MEIKDYFCIGDLHSCALVSKKGSIDWLCLPHFDSPSIFAKMLDRDGGSFSIEARGYKIGSSYLKDTAIVEFKFKREGSEFNVHDFMVPVPESVCKNHFLVRKFIGVRGRSKVSLIFNPLNSGNLLLHPPQKASVKKFDRGFKVDFGLLEGEEKEVVVEYVSSGCTPNYKGQDFEGLTEGFWRDWVRKGHFFNFCRDRLVRSAITLKLMQFYPTGAIIASPTTSLPEVIGGERNWDYRYVWIRDATFTIYALYVLGYLDEAERFFEFIKGVIEKCRDADFDISLMYTITGEPVPKEQVVKEFRGFKDSTPVRTGNGARDQFQLDVYGALIDSYYFISKRKLDVSINNKDLIMKLVTKISESWTKKDNGIWEVRNSPENFTYSKVMAWVGVDRAIRMAKQLKLKEEELKFCKKLEKQIKTWIWENCFDKTEKTFKQHPETSAQDATNLLFILLQFLDKHDPLTREIIKTTCQELSFKEVFVYRYKIADGLKGKEGAFWLCSFWLICAWAILENLKEAEKLFKKLEGYIDESGLLSEEINPLNGSYLGNFPQAFSHIGYIMSAYYLNRYSKKND